MIYFDIFAICRFPDGNLKYEEDKDFILETVGNQESCHRKIDDLLLLEKEIKRTKFLLKKVENLEKLSEKSSVSSDEKTKSEAEKTQVRKLEIKYNFNFKILKFP